VNQALILPPGPTAAQAPKAPDEKNGRPTAIAVGETPGPAGWNEAILNIIGQSQ
jgi:hypothetical protein